MPLVSDGKNLQLNISEMKDVLNALPHTMAVFCEGVHGIGKSSVFRQLATERDAIFIDMRLSQCEYTEIAGYPKDVDGKMLHLNPWWRTQIEEAAKENKNVVLLFDEMNRAHKDVLQTVFQVVLDREVQGWKFPTNVKVWIYAAGNTGDDYDVTMMDPALVDRFFRFELRPSNDEWTNWAKDNDVHEAVVQFIMKNDNFLDPISNLDDTDEKMQSRRSWTKLSDVLNKTPELVNSEDTTMVQLLAAGFVGTKVAPKFAKFVREEFAQLTAYDILDKYDEMKDKIEKQCKDGLPEAAANSSILVELCTDVLKKEDGKKVSVERMKNYKKFLDIVNMDILCSAWQGLMGHSKTLEVINWLGKDEAFRKKVAAAVSPNMGG
ncbi:MAG: AAA domain-containing protein [Candidatus Scalindua sp.]|mgnify:CR=1 FL=1|jgi:hypothetical protein|nr:AAA domain-containing protein [Candidatus Scalindua sp.]